MEPSEANSKPLSDPLIFLKDLQGQPCWGAVINWDGTFRLCFGAEVTSKRGVVHGEWEIGTYNSAWRLASNTKIIVGSQDCFESQAEIEATMRGIQLGCFRSMVQDSPLDHSIHFDSGIVMEVLGTTACDDEVLHVFMPNNRYMEFTIKHGWTAKPANPSLGHT